MTRRVFLRLALLAGAGTVAVLAGARPRRTLAAPSRASGAEGFVADGRASSSIHFDFRSAPDRATWGRRWLAVHYERRLDVRRGAARFVLPKGLRTTAPNQPMPVFLTDCDARGGTQVVTFTTSNRTLRPGLLLEGRPPFTYLAVTVEAGRIVLARYGRADRTVLHRTFARRLRAGTAYTLKVTRTRRRVRVKLWRGAQEPKKWDLDVRLDGARHGCFGMLVVHPSNRRAATLRIRDYRLTVSGAFSSTKPTIPHALSGVPVEASDGSNTVRVRAASSLPAAISFEWSHGPNGMVVAGAELAAEDPPYTASREITVPPGSDLRWRARVRSLSSGTQVRSAWRSVTCTPAAGPVVLAAASCAQVWGKLPLVGLREARAAAPAPVRAFVYQGDLGYANNSYRSCYLSAADFFADRLTRFLADPELRTLTRSASASFTLDDHDYGPRNNAWKDTVQGWAVELWNELHADTSDAGYRDFRVGDVHCLTLDVRRYADQPSSIPDADISRLGPEQLGWLEGLLAESDAELFVVFSAGIFASRLGTNDCFLFGWRREYDRVLTLLHDVQLTGRRVVLVSGDAHGFRVHHHPDPAGRPAAARLSVVELVCAGLEARTWSPASFGDPTLDSDRNVMDVSGLGLIAIDPPGAADRTLTLRAIASHPAGAAPTPDLFSPLVLPFRPAPTDAVPRRAPAPRPTLTATPQE